MSLIDSLATTPELAAVFSDASVIAALLQFETALAGAQSRLGILPPLELPGPEAFDAAAIADQARGCATIAIPFVRALRARVPEAHHGATSQDLMDTALVLLLRRAREILARDQARLADTLRALSDRHAGTIMLSRTLLQPALPITFGYKVAGWYSGVSRSWRRLAASFDQAIVLQFGGASGTLAFFGDRGPSLAEELARQLGLAAPPAPWHTQRDRLAAVSAHCGIYTGAVAKIARDIVLLMQAEVAEAAEPGGGSSAMPDKRNPSRSIVALAAAARVPPLVAAYLAAMPQEHERAAGGWQSEWQVVADIVQSTGAALSAVADALDGLTVDAARMRANLAAAGPVADHRGPPARPEDNLGAAEAFRRRLLQE